MGLRAEMTKASGDGGIDIVAVLDQPVLGGKYLVQCKRFASDTVVGSPTVREFYGALVADRSAIKESSSRHPPSAIKRGISPQGFRWNWWTDAGFENSYRGTPRNSNDAAACPARPRAYADIDAYEVP